MHKQCVKALFLTWQMPVLSDRTDFDPFLKTWKILTPKFPMKYSKNGQNLQHIKILKMWYLRHAEHHAKNRTSLCGLHQETLFFDWPLISYTLWNTHKLWTRSERQNGGNRNFFARKKREIHSRHNCLKLDKSEENKF